MFSLALTHITGTWSYQEDQYFLSLLSLYWALFGKWSNNSYYMAQMGRLKVRKLAHITSQRLIDAIWIFSNAMLTSSQLHTQHTVAAASSSIYKKNGSDRT